MASLDFAFLAEFAKVELNATITAVGAGVRGIRPPVGKGDNVHLFVAGGVERDRGEGEVSLTVTVEPPSGEYSVSQTAVMEPATEIGDFATTVFAIGMFIPIVGEGKYQVIVALDEERAKTLDLWVRFAVPVLGDLPDGA